MALRNVDGQEIHKKRHAENALVSKSEGILKKKMKKKHKFRTFGNLLVPKIPLVNQNPKKQK